MSLSHGAVGLGIGHRAEPGFQEVSPKGNHQIGLGDVKGRNGLLTEYRLRSRGQGLSGLHHGQGAETDGRGRAQGLGNLIHQFGQVVRCQPQEEDDAFRRGVLQGPGHRVNALFPGDGLAAPDLGPAGPVRVVQALEGCLRPGAGAPPVEGMVGVPFHFDGPTFHGAHHQAAPGRALATGGGEVHALAGQRVLGLLHIRPSAHVFRHRAATRQHGSHCAAHTGQFQHITAC